MKDDETYNDFVHTEESDGKVISGSYRVELPDGRTQIVTYVADHNGYRADVKYEGVAKLYEYTKAANKVPVYVAKEESYEKTYDAPTYKESSSHGEEHY